MWAADRFKRYRRQSIGIVKILFLA